MINPAKQESTPWRIWKSHHRCLIELLRYALRRPLALVAALAEKAVHLASRFGDL